MMFAQASSSPPSVLTIASLLFLATTTFAHVQLTYPPSIIDSDYQYTFASGVCNANTCDAFCGSEGSNPPVTTVSPGPLDVTLLVNVRHQPFRYRIAFHDGSDDGKGGVGGFDNNVLLGDIELSAGMNGNEGMVTIDIPDVECGPGPCTLQLFDMYYFVSCSRILIERTGDGSEEGNGGNDGGDDGETDAVIIAPVTDDMEYGTPMINQEDEIVLIDGIAAVRFVAELTSSYPTYLAVALSFDQGAMVGSRAVVGTVDFNDNNGIVDGSHKSDEYQLGGKFRELVTEVTNPLDQIHLESSFVVTETPEGLYEHRLTAAFRLDIGDSPWIDSWNIDGIEAGSGAGITICGMDVIWAHSSNEGSSGDLSYHGLGARGRVLPVVCDTVGDGSGSGDEVEKDEDEDKDTVKDDEADDEDSDNVPSITSSPTMSPTKNPAASSTASPTMSPTKNPSTSSTASPTTSPTPSPTASPSTPNSTTMSAALGTMVIATMTTMMLLVGV